ncbi:MAG: hemolysin family protein [Sporichthyaceae bacterium]
MSDRTALLVAVVLLAFNAFFVGAEFALISARRTQIEPRAAAGSWAAKVTLGAMERVTVMMAGAQFGITICSLGLGAIGEPAVAHTIEPGLSALSVPDGLLHPIAFAIALTLVVALHVVLGEMVPKNIAIAGPERSALVLGPPMVAVVAVLRPFVLGLNAVANGVLRLLRVAPSDEVRSTYTSEEVADLVEESHREGLLDPEEYGLLAAALGFESSSVERVVIGMDRLVVLPRRSTRAEVEQRCVDTGFSRFPLVEGGRLVGYVHVKDVLADAASAAETFPSEVVRPLATVGADTGLHDALRLMQSRGSHLVAVVDPGGEPLGVVMLADLIAELVGSERRGL